MIEEKGLTGTAKDIMYLICKHERKPTEHSIDGEVIKDQLNLSKSIYDMIKDYKQYTCQSCHSSFYYRKKDLPYVPEDILDKIFEDEMKKTF